MMNKYIVDEIVNKYYWNKANKMIFVVFFAKLNGKFICDCWIFNNEDEFIEYIQKMVQGDTNVCTEIINCECYTIYKYFDQMTIEKMPLMFKKFGYGANFATFNKIIFGRNIIYHKLNLSFRSEIKLNSKKKYVIIFTNKYFDGYIQREDIKNVDYFCTDKVDCDNEISIYIGKKLVNYFKKKLDNHYIPIQNLYFYGICINCKMNFIMQNAKNSTINWYEYYKDLINIKIISIDDIYIYIQGNDSNC